ncbi:hypothetical protein BBK36DRAFT_1186271, partial [Trichoderma citrinoviride]
KKECKKKTYNSRCSPMVTHLTTNLPVSGLSMGEQTRPRIFRYLWSYVLNCVTDCFIDKITGDFRNIVSLFSPKYLSQFFLACRLHLLSFFSRGELPGSDKVWDTTMS